MFWELIGKFPGKRDEKPSNGDEAQPGNGSDVMLIAGTIFLTIVDDWKLHRFQ